LVQIHQLLPTLDIGDAISNQALEIREILRDWGYRSDIYAENIHPRLRSECRHYQEYRGVSCAHNILIYHYSIGSRLIDYFKTLPDKKIMIYHNITPHQFMEGYNDRLAQLLREGRQRLAELLGIPMLCLADSEYNRRELMALGYERVRILPIIYDFQKLQRPADPEVLKRYSDGLTNILHVGRIVPNKRYEDLIKTFYFYHKHINPRSRLILVGSYTDMQHYYSCLQGLVNSLGLDQVIFTGKVSLEGLIAYYQTSRVFLSLSEHEGFGVPLLEAMFFKLPIIAYKSTAIPDTLGKAGILVKEKHYEEIAELIHIVAQDSPLRTRIIEVQSARLEDFSRVKILQLLDHYLTEVREAEPLRSLEGVR